MCVMRVTGKKFDPQRFLASSTLQPYSVFRVGDPRFPSLPEGPKHYWSGFEVEVCRGSRATLVEQVPDAIAFLKKHRRTLAKLQRTRGVEDIRLDIPVDLRIDRKTIVTQFDYFPPELVALAGAVGCGLEISIYPRDLERLSRGTPAHTARLRKKGKGKA